MPGHMAWLTPDEPTTPGEVCRVLRFPRQFEQHVRGALGLLTFAFNWEISGDMTPDECAEAMFAMWDGIRGCKLIGSVHEYFTASLPDGVLPCDGSVFNREDYPDLYAVISPNLIIDEDTFHTPNLIDRAIQGAIADDVGEEIGEATHTLTVEELVPHDHPYSNGYGPDTAAGFLGTVSTAFAIQPTDLVTGSTGDGEPFNVVGPRMGALMGMIAR